MVDLYRMPAGLPDLDNAHRFQDPIERAQFLETAFANDVNNPRFVPFIQVHEFEALLFSDPSAFAAAFPGRNEEIAELERIRRSFPSPEHIDDGKHTSPSKRISALFPAYEKVASGVLIARRIGLRAILRECAHFGGWVNKLRALR